MLWNVGRIEHVPHPVFPSFKFQIWNVTFLKECYMTFCLLQEWHNFLHFNDMITRFIEKASTYCRLLEMCFSSFVVMHGLTKKHLWNHVYFWISCSPFLITKGTVTFDRNRSVIALSLCSMSVLMVPCLVCKPGMNGSQVSKNQHSTSSSSLRSSEVLQDLDVLQELFHSVRLSQVSVLMFLCAT